MIYARYALLNIIICLVLYLLKWVVVSIFPYSETFMSYAVTDLQLLVFVFFTLLIICRFILLRLGKKTFRIKYYVIYFFGILSVVEISLFFLLSNPSNLPNSWQVTFNYYYELYLCDRVQFNSESATYNPETTYTLKPNSAFTFSNYEFSHKITTNSMGLRDTENSLSEPAIICLGDSYTMGWGVAQDKSFPELMEKNMQAKVLNAGIASFGTARELTLLQKLDTRSLKFVVIQYHQNDAVENQTFLQHGNRVPVRTVKQYDSICKSLQFTRIYLPFKHALTLINVMLTKDVLNMDGFLGTDILIDDLQQSVNFINVFDHFKINNSTAQVIVVDMTGYAAIDQGFSNSLHRVLADSKIERPIHILNLSGLLNKDHFFYLDTHINEAGHALVAKELINFIGKLE